MGVWGPGSFDNDAALDLAHCLTDEQSLAPARRLLARYAGLEPADFVFDGELAEAIAAAEVVAAASGFPVDRLPPDLAAWLANATTAIHVEDLAQALAAVALAQRGLAQALVWLGDPARRARYFEDNAAYWAANGEHYEPTLAGLHASFAPPLQALVDLEQRLIRGRGRLGLRR